MCHVEIKFIAAMVPCRGRHYSKAVFEEDFFARQDGQTRNRMRQEHRQDTEPRTKEVTCAVKLTLRSAGESSMVEF